MLRTKRLKIIVIILIVLSVSVLPMAFGISYAKWTGGADSIDASVNVYIPGGGTEKPDEHSDIQLGENGGLVIWNPNENKYELIAEGSSGFESQGTGGSGYIRNPYVDEDKPFEIQIFIHNPLQDGKLTAINWDLDSNTINDGIIEHEPNSYWYKLPHAGHYNIGIFYEEGFVIGIHLNTDV